MILQYQDDGTMEGIPEEHHEDPHGGLPSDVEPHDDAEVHAGRTIKRRKNK